MPDYGREYPFTDSDLPCRVCGRWFPTTGDVIAHEEQVHHLAQDGV